MKLFIVTGASKGLGREMLRQLMRPGHGLVGIARGDGAELQEEARAKGVPLRWIACDLSDAAALPAVMDEALAGFAERVGAGADGVGASSGDAAGVDAAGVDAKGVGMAGVDAEDNGAAGAVTGCALINNAATVEPIAPLSRCSASDIVRSVTLNLIAPMVLTAEFLRRTAGWNVDRRVLNVSSGAGRNPCYGWSVYCASKAGMDMFTRVAGEEERESAGAARVLSVAPGVVDTDMQRRIRETDAGLFRDRDRFIRLKESGALAGAEEAAARLLRVLFDDRYPTGSVLDVRELD
jgi:benzil reductase ((S)-benzoin forming)